jgi:hypothetical protein
MHLLRLDLLVLVALPVPQEGRYFIVAEGLGEIFGQEMAQSTN